MDRLPNPFESIDSRLSNIEKLLLDIYAGTHIKPPDNDPNGLLTVDQAADLLHLSVPTIYGLIHRREISSLKGAAAYTSRRRIYSNILKLAGGMHKIPWAIKEFPTLTLIKKVNHDK